MPGIMLPPGFRFHPTDEELVAYYLKRRVKNFAIDFDVIADVDLYKCEPWDLPSKSRLPGNDLEWFFFSPRDRKYPNGARTNRATEAGYWKATGRDRFVKTGSKTIGMKKTLVFYMGRAPHGERTHWLMHEYRLDGEEWEATTVSQDAYVLCRVFKKNGLDLPKLGGVGSGEEVDNAESPSEEKNPVFFEYDVKPSLELPPQPLTSTATQAPPVAMSLGQQALQNMAAMQPSTAPVFSDFDIDGMSFPKMDSSNFDWGDFQFPEETPDFIPNPLQEHMPDGRSEFPKGGWLQEQMLGGNFSSDSPWNIKYEDPLAIQNSVQLAAGGGDFEDLDLPPPLEDQSPSPSALPPSSTIEDSCVVDSPFQPATIQIRPRLPSTIRSQVARSAPNFTAKHRVLMRKSNRPPHLVAEDEEHGASKPTHKLAPGASDVKPYKTAASAESAHGYDVSSAVAGPESEVENVGTQKSSEPLSETATSSVVESSSQLAPLASISESSLPQLLHDEVEDKGAKETNINTEGVDLDQHAVMKSCVAEVDNQKALTGVFHIKGYGELPPGIGSIHVNAVTISCSCDKVNSKPHVQATVCDCYDNSKGADSQVLEEPRGTTEEKGLGDGQSWDKNRGGFRKSYACVFLMGAVSACVGFFVSHEVWRVTRQIVRSGVQIVTAAGDL
ncbi:unnamed protein product [Calypogeia fissa]